MVLESFLEVKEISVDLGNLLEEEDNAYIEFTRKPSGKVLNKFNLIKELSNSWVNHGNIFFIILSNDANSCEDLLSITVK